MMDESVGIKVGKEIASLASPGRKVRVALDLRGDARDDGLQ